MNHRTKRERVAFWLVKTEPSSYSFADLERDGRTTWNGVRNNQALIHLRSMKQGDRVFIYHSGNEKCIVGIAEVVSDPYPDPSLSDPRVVVVDIEPRERLKKPVTLGDIRAHKEFGGFELLRISRLSVMPVTAVYWKKFITMSH